MRGIWLLCLTAAAYAQTGESLFLNHCAVCHGAKGEGGRGSVLSVNRLRHARNDDELYRVIRRGIAGTGMPGTGFSDGEVRLVMAHVRSLGKAESTTVRGDAQNGKRIYDSKCAQCHAAFGPDLSGAGARRSPAHLRQSLLEPEADVPRGFVLVRAVSRDRTVTGVRVNEDTFSIQIRDVSGALHSFWKSELREVKFEHGRSGMPSYKGTLSESELDDVVAYLVSLQEAR